MFVSSFVMPIYCVQQLEDLDPEAVAKGLSESEAAVATAKDEVERAEAQIGVDVYMAMQGALSTK